VRWASCRAAATVVLVLRPVTVKLHELEAFSVLHGRSILSKVTPELAAYLDRLHVLLVVQGHRLWVQVEEVAHSVADVGAHAVIPAILEPHLDQAFFGPQ